MSTQIGIIEGECENPTSTGYLDQDLIISTFMGRERRGFSVQLAINSKNKSKNSYIQLNKKEVLQLINVLNEIYKDSK